MELRHLRSFIKTAELQHIAQAAQALHLTQPALSVQIRQLEEELGTVLFDRVGRGIQLTPSGRLFLAHARRAVGEVEHGREEVSELMHLRRGSLTLGVTHTFGTRLLPEVLTQYAKLYPEIQLQVLDGPTQEIVGKLSSGEVDVAMMFVSSLRSEFMRLELFREEPVVVVAKNHPLAKAKRLSLADLNEVKLALPGQGYGLRRLLDQGFARFSRPPSLLLESNNIGVILAIVALGSAVTVLPRCTVSHLRHVVCVPLKEKGFSRRAVLLWRKGSHPAPSVRRFAEIVVKELYDLGSTPPNLSLLE